MAVPIAELFVSVSADVSAAIGGLNSLNTQLNKTTNWFQQAAPAALLFEAAGAGIIGAVGGAVKVAADFEQSIANIRAVMSPAEASQFGGAISDLALKLGRDTVFSASQAAAGIEELIKGGIPAEDVLNGAAEAAVNLAAATGSSIPFAANVATSAMSAFGITAAGTTGAVDTLAGVINATRANITDLKFGLEVVGPTAHSLGLSFEDTAKAIGLLTNAGESGQVAGTGLRQMLLELTPTTKPATEEMKKLGLITDQGKNIFFDAAGKLKGMADISQILQNALRGMSAEQRTAALNTLFTRDAINAASILAEDGAVKFNGLTEAMKGITAARTAEERLNTLEGTLTNLSGTIETAQILVGTTYVPSLKQLGETLNGLVAQFAKLDPSVRSGVVTFGLIAGVVLSAIGAFILFAPSIAAIGPALGAVVGVLASVAPIALVVAGVLLLLRRAWEENLGPVQAIKDAFSNIGDILQAAFAGDIGGAVNGFLEDISRLSPDIRNVITNIRSTITSLVTAVQPVLTILGAAFDQAFSGNFGGALDILQGLAGTINPVLGNLIGTARQLAATIGPVLGQAFQTVGQFIQEHTPDFQRLANDVLPLLGQAFQTVGQFIGDHLPEFQQLAADVLPKLDVIAQNIGAFWETTLAPAIGSVRDTIVDLLPRALTLAEDAWPKILETTQNLQVFWDTQLQPAIQGIIDKVGPAVSRLGELKDAFTGVIVPGVQSFINDFTTSLDKIGVASAQQTQTNQFLVDLGTSLSNFGTQVSSLGPLFGALGNFFTALGNLGTAITNVQAAVASGIFDQFADALARFGVAAGPAAPAVEAVSTVIETLGGKLGGATDFINSGAAAINNLTAALNAFAAAPTLPQFALPGGLPNVFGTPGAPNPGATGGANVVATAARQEAGPLIQVGQLIISSEAEATAFLDRMGQAIAQAAKRANPPPDNTGVPVLEPAGGTP